MSLFAAIFGYFACWNEALFNFPNLVLFKGINSSTGITIQTQGLKQFARRPSHRQGIP